MNVSTRQLRAFLALAEERSFTRAAAALPPVAAGLQRADPPARRRGRRCALFDRSTRHVEPTAEGARVRGLQRGACWPSSTPRSAACASARARERGRVSIALLPSLAAGWLPAGAGRLSRRVSRASSWRSADVLSEPCIERVRSGQADFALAATRADTPELRAELLLQRRLPPRLPRRPPAGEAAATRARATWRRIPSCTCRARRACASTSTRRRTRSRCRALLEVDQLATVAGMVRAGLGISIVPALTLYQFALAGAGHAAAPLAGARAQHLPGAPARPCAVVRGKRVSRVDREPEAAEGRSRGAPPKSRRVVSA